MVSFAFSSPSSLRALHTSSRAIDIAWTSGRLEHGLVREE
jgi:hypothetical protein